MSDNNRQTVVRSMHDLGLAAWFGGSLFGAVGLNSAVKDIRDPSDRALVSSSGWARFSPVNAIGIGAHLIGGAGLVLGNQGRIKNQSGAGANTAVKTVLTIAAMGATAYSASLGAKVAEYGRVPAESGTDPSASTPPEVAKAQKQLKVLQYVIPALTGTLVVLGAQQGEQQKPSQILGGGLRGLVGR